MVDNYYINTTNSIRRQILGLDALVRLEDKRMVPAINFDNAATTPAFKQVACEVMQKLKCYGSIGRGKGQKSEYSSEIYSRGREIVKSFVGANSDSYTVIYVNNTTDGMNKLASALIENPNDLVLTTRMEHHANDLPWRERAKTLYVEVDELGRLIIDDFERLLNDHDGKIKYVTVTAASNVTGYVNDVHYIAKIAHKYRAKIIVDGAQIVAHRPFSMLGRTPEESIDYFVFSAHKMYAPFGGGAVVGLTDELNRHIPKFYGGGMVDAVCDYIVNYGEAPDLYEAGSPNYPGVVGMLKAIEMLNSIGFDYVRSHEQQLLKYSLDELKQIPEVILYGDNQNFDDKVGLLVFNLRGITPENVANMLSAYSGIAVRHAAFCAHPYVRRLTEGLVTQGDVLCTPPQGMVRVSFGIYNNKAEVDSFLSTIKRIIRLGSTDARSDVGSAKSLSAIRLPNDRG